MIAEIVSVGTELLMGQVLNTDAQHIARHIAPLGLACRYQITVGDNASRLTEVVHTALSRADVVFFTGGLGPTDDDLTKETVAAALGLRCEPVKWIDSASKCIFPRRSRIFPHSAAIQSSLRRAPYRSCCAAFPATSA